MVELILIAPVALLVIWAFLRFARARNKSALLHQLGFFSVGLAFFLVWAPWISAVPRETALEQNPELQIPEDWGAVPFGGGQAWS